MSPFQSSKATLVIGAGVGATKKFTRAQSRSAASWSVFARSTELKVGSVASQDNVLYWDIKVQREIGRLLEYRASGLSWRMISDAAALSNQHGD
ncbi:hypothetical protein PABG_11295 [Paracoccidioides brasiliensis Pb03]|nr:hypothetical protein PABG_11295 [Paracoccidioides brasiliensis Pb03]